MRMIVWKKSLFLLKECHSKTSSQNKLFNTDMFYFTNHWQNLIYYSSRIHHCLWNSFVIVLRYSPKPFFLSCYQFIILCAPVWPGVSLMFSFILPHNTQHFPPVHFPWPLTNFRSVVVAKQRFDPQSENQYPKHLHSSSLSVGPFRLQPWRTVLIIKDFLRFFIILLNNFPIKCHNFTMT